MTLKTNLHFHAKNDEKISDYTIYQMIDYAKASGFDVLAYTPHKKFIEQKEFSDYAASRNLLLIPGIEIEIKGRHILVLNCDKKAENIKTFNELADYKKNNPHIFIIAPHPYVFSKKSLFSNLAKNIDVFDAIEMTVFSNSIFNFNKKAAETAAKYNKPFIATSDAHFLKDIERGCALIETEQKSAEAIFNSVRKNNFQNKMNSMSPLAMIKHMTKSILNFIFA